MKTLLIIDDDPAIRELLRIILQRAGYNVDTACDAALISGNDFVFPDLFLLDRHLGGIDGLDICRQLKRDVRSCNIPVVMISASPDISQLSREAGADDFIEKPFDIAELTAKISKFCLAERSEV